MESQRGRTWGSGAEPWMALALCTAVVAAGALKQVVRHRPFAPDGIALAAVALAAAGIIRLNGHPLWLRAQRGLLWGALLLSLWAANGLPLDLLRLIPGLMPPGIDWPRLATKLLALTATVVLARLVLAHPAAPTTRPASWYGYAAFVLALPYPVLRTWWALGGTPGLLRPGAAGPPMAWLACIPWLLAAALSLLLVPTWRFMPRRLLVTAGWFAAAVVGSIGPMACWALVSAFLVGPPEAPPGTPSFGIAMWVPCLFYSSWFLWAIAAAAATRSYQLRSAS